jgi:hypothetical protein
VKSSQAGLLMNSDMQCRDITVPDEYFRVIPDNVEIQTGQQTGAAIATRTHHTASVSGSENA